MPADPYREQFKGGEEPEQRASQIREVREALETRESPVPERQRATEYREEIRRRVEQEAERMEQTPELQQEVQRYRQAAQSGALDEDAKVQHLLDLARTKGVAYAFKIAKETENDYIVDALHDRAIEQGLYKELV